MNFIEIWDSLTEDEKLNICSALNLVQRDIEFHPGTLGITDISKTVTLLGSYSPNGNGPTSVISSVPAIAPFFPWRMADMIKDKLYQNGYKLSWTNDYGIKIERVGDKKPQPSTSEDSGS